jgi:cysteinyl-tRNA synthetase
MIAQLFEGVRFANLLKDGQAVLTKDDLDDFAATFRAFLFDVLGLKDEKEAAGHQDKVEGLVSMLIGMRNQARADRDFAMSDHIRDQLAALGIQLKDGKDGTTFSF